GLHCIATENDRVGGGETAEMDDDLVGVLLERFLLGSFAHYAEIGENGVAQRVAAKPGGTFTSQATFRESGQHNPEVVVETETLNAAVSQNELEPAGRSFPRAEQIIDQAAAEVPPDPSRRAI